MPVQGSGVLCAPRQRSINTNSASESTAPRKKVATGATFPPKPFRMGGLLVAPRPELDAQVDVAISPQLPVSLIDAGLKARWSLALRPPSYLGGRFQISRYQSQLILPGRYLDLIRSIWPEPSISTLGFKPRISRPRRLHLPNLRASNLYFDPLSPPRSM